MRFVWLAFLFAVVAAVSVLGFRGTRFKQPPLEVFPDMDRQPKYKPQQESKFFPNGMTDRPVPANTVARGRSVAEDPTYLAEDDHMYRGYRGPLLPEGTEWYRGFPQEIEINRALLDRGRDREALFCSPCHGTVGDGNGITKLYGMGATPSWHDDRIRQMPEGQIFNTITNGKNTMMGYGDRIPPADRWAIIAYVRALQRAREGTVDDVPAAHRADLGL
jgi:mono/diheme cytochrome c family protein